MKIKIIDGMACDAVGQAVFSECCKYRYSLTREWDRDKKKVLFLLLNPSTADESKNDPTIRRCINYAKDWGYGGLYIGNIFAFRATDPLVMKKQSDPIGPLNNGFILYLHKQAAITVAGWGSNGSFLDREAYIKRLLKNNIYYLKLTKDRHPGHPLYLKKDLKPIRYGEK